MAAASSSAASTSGVQQTLGDINIGGAGSIMVWIIALATAAIIVALYLFRKH